MTLGNLTAPGDLERSIRPDELFFSTTDNHGRIRTGNSVFVRISGYSMEELTGAPHSIVRHPEMPAGVFRLMWDRLLAGRPVGAYVLNRAKDGGHYWVFATMTPSADGFLSVRVAPAGPLFAKIQQAYRYVLAAERHAAEHEGLSRREVAHIGLRTLEGLLDELGFGSHDEFLAEALTGEVTARGRICAAYARPHARGPIRQVLAGAEALEGMLAGLVLLLDDYRMFSERLAHASGQVLDVARRLDRAVAAAQTASRMVAATTPVLGNVAEVMAGPMSSAVAALERLSPRLADLRENVTDLRFRIALASLHTDMIASFAAEVVDGEAPPTSLREVPLLCDAVQDSVLDMSARAGQVNGTLREIIGGIAEAGERLLVFQRFLGQWRILVGRHRAQRTLGDLVQPIDEELFASWNAMDMLRKLGEEFRRAVVPFDVAALQSHVARIRAEVIES
ncbi:PAS domain-containing protein [Thermopolyspora sp. NPDC052614]|uniref:PAS domain-containing protein n=1 Tax=Thermopolyspora sp. NPDC052614 TaxID=3155682 RepID=UPI003441CE22